MLLQILPWIKEDYYAPAMKLILQAFLIRNLHLYGRRGVERENFRFRLWSDVNFLSEVQKCYYASYKGCCGYVVSLVLKDMNFGELVALFFYIIPFSIYTLLPAVFKSLNATLKEVLFLTVQKVIYCTESGCRNLLFSAFEIADSLMEPDQVNNVDAQSI